MGWNSWNRFKERIDDRIVRETADALVETGLRDAGYVYLNIDDGWQGDRIPSGALQPNEKFPDMAGLVEYAHERGLKFGIYTSPGPLTCAGYLGSHGYEREDAQQFADWGVDLLKHDWCSAGLLYSTADEMRALYQKMGDALLSTGRPIVFSLCQYGLFDVGQWGHAVGANLWRTGGDLVIGDRWTAVSKNGFEDNAGLASGGPGGWNDPDIMVIGLGGLDHEESRTHISLWALQSAPLLLGNDVRALDPEDAELLLNPEVIAIDQDPLGAPARRVLRDGSVEVWVKSLADGSTAVGLFNRGESAAEALVNLSDLGVQGTRRVRDVWARAEIAEQTMEIAASVPGHGTALLRIGHE